MIKAFRQRRAYNRARLAIIAKWIGPRDSTGGQYANGYYDGLDAAVRIIARELAGEGAK